jgi:hypothetical protein
LRDSTDGDDVVVSHLHRLAVLRGFMVHVGAVADFLARSRRVLAWTCLLAPFVDERFILAIPLAMSVRWVFSQWDQQQDQERKPNPFLVDAGIVLATAGAYLLLRIVLLTGNSVAAAYLSRRQSELHEPLPLRLYLLGTWMSLRLVWLLVICLIALTFRQRRWAPGLALLATVAFSLVTALVIASDLSRSMCVLLPAAPLGLLLLAHEFPRTAKIVLPALLIGNLVLPPSNVVMTFTEPIYSVLVCIDMFRYPPGIVDPAFYLKNGKEALDQGKPAEAIRFLDWSLKLDPQSSSAWLVRAMAKAKLKDFAGAAADEHAAMQLPPSSP